MTDSLISPLDGLPIQSLSPMACIPRELMWKIKSEMLETLSQLEISTHSPFEKIPRELFWKVIEFAPESALKLRSASKTLKLRLEEYTLAHLQDSYVDELCFIGRSQILGPTSLSLLPYEAPAPRNYDMEIEMMVHERHAALFSLRLFQPFLYPRLRKNKYSTEPNRMTFSIELNSKIKQDKLLKYLDNCLGARIGRVVIKEWKTPINHDVIKSLLEGKTIGEMEVSGLTNDAVFKLLMPIDAYKVDVLDLTVDKNEAGNPAALLHDLSSVPAMIIRQRHVSGIASTEIYFFGIKWPLEN